MTNQRVAIIGGGSSSLILAEQLASHYDVTIYEKGKTIGRKYLVAGKGGFNLAHNFDTNNLIKTYTPSSFLQPALDSFGVEALRKWYKEIGIETFVGSSNRVFPVKGISPADVLRTIKKRLESLGVLIQLESEFVGFEGKKPLIDKTNGKKSIDADYYIFCLGGGSWKVTGSNSGWFSHFHQIGVTTNPFQSSNCGLNIDWKASISDHHIGKPLKNIAVSCNRKLVKGEAVISQYGIEGNAIYPISAEVRKLINNNLNPTISIDFKPTLSRSEIFDKIKNTKSSNFKKQLNLNSASWAIIKEFTTKEEFIDLKKFSFRVKQIEIPIQGLRPVEEAISTVGGIQIDNLNEDYSLKSHPNIFCIGEMVDWDAPTGGFLLQGCFSMGYYLAQKLIHKKTD